MKRLTVVVLALAMVFGTTFQLAASAPVLTGGIRGVVIENTGHPLSAAVQVQLVNSRGIDVLGKTAMVAAGTGAFSFADVEPGIYTVRVIGAAGSAAVSVVAGRVSAANVTVAAQAAVKTGMKTSTKWIIAAAAIGGGATVWAIAANKNDASGSQ